MNVTPVKIRTMRRDLRRVAAVMVFSPSPSLFPSNSAGSAALRRQRLDVVRRQRLAPDGPLPASDLEDAHPRDPAQGLPFDSQHGLGDLLDRGLLLRVVENSLDELNVDERHGRLQ